MSLPSTAGGIIDDADFNSIHTRLDAILGMGDDGYGLATFFSSPVAPTDRDTAWQWNTAINDITVIQRHIDNTTYSQAHVVTGTTIINHDLPNIIKTAVDYYYDPVRRFTCHPAQFLSVSGQTTFFDGGTSTRTLSWGVSTSTITHRVVASFPTRSTAYYYFNQGAFLSWQPFHYGDGLNDLDGEWASFIDYLAAVKPYKYTRSEFRNWPGGTSTVYTSGTLAVTVLGVVEPNERQVTFTVTYGNNNTRDLSITPTVGYWNYIV